MKVEVAVLGCPSLTFISLAVSVDVKRHYIIIIVQCFSASTETVRTIRDREPLDDHLGFHTASELCSSVLLYVHRDRKDC